jgi:hypothetical protein
MLGKLGGGRCWGTSNVEEVFRIKDGCSMAYGSWGRPYAVEQPSFLFPGQFFHSIFPSKAVHLTSNRSSITTTAIVYLIAIRISKF